jgi:hypothetical protein
MPTRYHDVQRFYAILGRLEATLGGSRVLSACSGRTDWPRRGVYFFFEPGESRLESGTGSRVVRVGTHALSSGSGTKLWTRLSQHRGQVSDGGGNHRGSIFRLIIGSALMARDGHECATWGRGSSATGEVRATERVLEREVSCVIRAMPFIWLPADDEPGSGSVRGYLERNSIALLSNYDKEPVDAPSPTWLGHHCDRPRVRKSGLWNSNHVDEAYDPAFLDVLDQLASGKTVKA